MSEAKKLAADEDSLEVPLPSPIPEQEAAEDSANFCADPPFEARSFGGEFMWARAGATVVKILRVMEGKSVNVSSQGRKDMSIMLTCGRAVMEVCDGDNVEQSELQLAKPLPIVPDRSYRLVALTFLELHSVYTETGESDASS